MSRTHIPHAPGMAPVSAFPLRGLHLVDRRTLADGVYEELRSRLTAGQLAAGQRLSLRDIGLELGVSVMPVREAVSRLVGERALEITHSRVLRVPLCNSEQVRDLADLRSAVEGFAAERAAQFRTAAELATIEAAEVAMRAESVAAEFEPYRLAMLDQALHFAIYEAARLPQLVKMIADLWLKVGPMLSADAAPMPAASSDLRREHPARVSERAAPGVALTAVALTCHAAAVQAIRAGDAPGARAAIVQDIELAARFVIACGDSLAS